MKISKLHLKNFRSHQDTKIELERFTFITGQNAVGKSSIAMAVEMLLTGRCAVTDAKGSGAEELVRAGAREFYVAGQVGKQLVERSNGGKAHTIDVGGRSGPVKEMQELICRGLGVSGDVLSAVLNSGRFLSMDEKAQKQLLAQVLASDDAETPKEVLADMEAVGSGAVLRTLTVSDVDASYKQFYEQRTATNRELKALGAVEEPELPEGAPDSAAVWKKMDDLRNELTRLTSERARTEERYHSAVREADAKRKHFEGVKVELAKKQLSRDELEKATATVAKLEESAKLAQKVKTLGGQILEKANAIASACREQIGILTAQRDAAQSQMDAVKKLKGAECPTCTRPINEAQRRELQAVLQEAIAAFNEKIEGLNERARAGGTNEQQAELEQLGDKLNKAKEQLAAIGDVAAAENMLRRDREAIVEISRCDRELASISLPVAPNFTEADEKIATLNSRIGKGEEVLETVREFDRKKGAYDAWVESKAQIEARVEILDRLVEFFGPNGIKAQMVGDKIKPFTNAMNAILGEFGYGVGFTMDPYQFVVFTPGQKQGELGRNLKQLSESEQFRFGVAFQVALAMATGLKFVVVDRADILDSDSRTALTCMLLESDLDQAIVLSTTDKNPPETLPEGVKFIQLGQKQPVAA